MKEYQIDLSGDGDFRSQECLNILDRSDVVVTNPPFSLFREYVATMLEHERNFLIIGSLNAVTYKEIFPYIKNNRIWLGVNNVSKFLQPDDTIKKFGNILWYTDMIYPKRHVPLELTKKYDPEKYPRYDNYDAIEVSRVADIPYDYMGEVGVPCTFLSKHDPDQFEIVGFRKGSDGKDLRLDGEGDKYGRIIIKRTSPSRDCSEDSERMGGGEIGVPISFLTKHCPEQFEIVGLCASHGKIPKGIPNENGYLNGRWVFPRVLIRRRIHAPSESNEERP